MISELLKRIRLIVGKATIEKVVDPKDDAGLSADLSMLADETHSEVPMVQQYGIASKPKKGSGAVVLFVGGSRDNGIIVSTQGEPSSIPSLDDGEVAIFSEYGQTILLKKDGSIVAKPKSGSKYRIESDVETTGDIVALCDTTKITMSEHIHQTGVGASSPPQKGI